MLDIHLDDYLLPLLADFEPLMYKDSFCFIIKYELPLKFIFKSLAHQPILERIPLMLLHYALLVDLHLVLLVKVAVLVKTLPLMKYPLTDVVLLQLLQPSIQKVVEKLE